MKETKINPTEIRISQIRYTISYMKMTINSTYSTGHKNKNIYPISEILKLKKELAELLKIEKLKKDRIKKLTQIQKNARKIILV